jgi:UDP-glucose 4-epimerase
MGPSVQDFVTRFFSLPLVPTLLGFDPLLQFVHEEDCLRAFETAVLESHPGVYNVVGRGVLPLSTILALAGKRALPVPSPLWYRVLRTVETGRTGDPPAAFYDYLRWLWVADGERGWSAFGEPFYSTREAWISFVSSRRLRRYR